MAEEEMKMSEELEGKKFRQTGEVFEKVADLDEDDLDEVSGGFKSKKGFSKGFKIKCPKCRAKTHDDIIRKGSDRSASTDYFYCNNCGTFFAADAGGHIYETY